MINLSVPWNGNPTCFGKAVIAITLLTTGIGGCVSKPAPAVPGVLTIHASEYHRVFAAAVRVLRDEGMALDRQDFRFGVITTKPIAAATLFEPWRSGDRVIGQALDNTVNDQRRQVTITLMPQDVAEVLDERADMSEVTDVLADVATEAVTQYTLRVDVQVERHEMPVHYLTGSMAGHAVMKRLRAAPEELARRNIAGQYWQPLGRDVALEGRLAETIIRKSMSP